MPPDRPRPHAVAVAAIAAVGLFLLLGARSGPELSPDRASWTLTPGVLNPDVTQETIGQTICVPGWTKTVRPPTDYTNRLKREQMAAYRRAGPASDYQEDHLIGLLLGGHPTDPRNLWPQPVETSRRVARIELELRDAVCAGRLPLAEAQRRISRIKHTTG